MPHSPPRSSPHRPNLLLAEALAAAGFTGAAVARRLRLHRSTISRALNGHNRPGPVTAHRIAALLNTTPEALGLAEIGGEA